jgi:glycosyltransferase involved in cell wall biosynthesis
VYQIKPDSRLFTKKGTRISTNDNVLVSIGLPVYNGSQYICQALDSLLAQTHIELEIIISDNASTDETRKLCTEYAQKDARIRYYRHPENMGAIWNYNHVFELSSGEFFMWASCDDYWDSNYTETCLQALAVSPRIIIAGTICLGICPDTGKVRLVDDGITTVGLPAIERFKKYKSTVHSGRHIGGIFYGLYRRRELEKVMPIKKLIAADHFLIADLSLSGEFVTVQKALFFKRWGGLSSDIKKSAAAIGVKNRFSIKAPYLIREYFMQRIISRSPNLSRVGKMRLAVWSACNYFTENLLKLSYIETKMYIKRLFEKFACRNAR